LKQKFFVPRRSCAQTAETNGAVLRYRVLRDPPRRLQGSAHVARTRGTPSHPDFARQALGIATDPDLKGIRTDSRFEGIVADAKLHAHGRAKVNETGFCKSGLAKSGDGRSSS